MTTQHISLGLFIMIQLFPTNLDQISDSMLHGKVKQQVQNAKLVLTNK